MLCPCASPNCIHVTERVVKISLLRNFNLPAEYGDTDVCAVVQYMSVCVLRAEHYWWRGQNRRTLRVGQFPRHVVTSVAGLSAQDISRPLKHSFIHTGHGDTDPHRSWGHPDRIDR